MQLGLYFQVLKTGYVAVCLFGDWGSGYVEESKVFQPQAKKPFPISI